MKKLLAQIILLSGRVSWTDRLRYAWSALLYTHIITSISQKQTQTASLEKAARVI